MPKYFMNSAKLSGTEHMIALLKESKARLLEQQSRDSASNWRIQGALDILTPCL